MAAAKPTQEAPAKAAETSTEFKSDAPTVEEVTLYNRDGETRTLTDPGAIVNAEFSGWSRNKDRFKKPKK